jgi:hypothetical protein
MYGKSNLFENDHFLAQPLIPMLSHLDLIGQVLEKLSYPGVGTHAQSRVAFQVEKPLAAI